MNYLKRYITTKLCLTITALLLLTTTVLNGQQKIGFGVHADPVISWFSSDIKAVQNNGARPGFNFGLTFNKYFTDNYSLSTGLSLITAGGRLTASDTTELIFTNFQTTVLPDKPIVYKIQYLSVPVGLKLQTNQIGYITFFTDLGLDPKVIVGGKMDIPANSIKGEKALEELRVFNLGYHITAGVEYSLGGTTALVVGLNFDNNFLDVTKENGNQPVDKISHKLLSFRMGVNF